MAIIEKILFYIICIFIFFRPFIVKLAFGTIDFYFTLFFLLAASPFLIIKIYKSEAHQPKGQGFLPSIRQFPFIPRAKAREFPARGEARLRRLRGIKLEKIDYFVITLVLSIIISTITSINAVISLNNLYIYFAYILLFYLARTCDESYKTTLIKTVIFSSLVISVYGIYQYFFGFKLTIEYLIRNQIQYPFAYEWLNRKRVFATFFSPNAYAGYLIMILPLIFSVNYLDKKNIYTIKVFLFVSLLTINLLLAQSISAIISLIISLFIILLIIKAKKNNLFLAILAILIMLLTICYIRNNSNNFFTTPLFSIQKRIHYYQEILSMIKNKPILGIGIGNYKGKFSLFAHNSYLQIWVELGILGILSYLGIVFLTIKNIFNKIKEAKHINYYLGLSCALISFMVHNLLDFTFFLPEVCWFWWLVVGLIMRK